MLQTISNHTHPSKITLDYKEEKSGRRSWYKKNYGSLLRKTPQKTYHMKGKRCLSALSHILLLHSFLWTFQQWFPPHKPSIPALRFMNCWVWWSMAHSHRWKKWRRFPLFWLLPWFSPPWTHLPRVTEYMDKNEKIKMALKVQLPNHSTQSSGWKTLPEV